MGIWIPAIRHQRSCTIELKPDTGCFSVSEIHLFQYILKFHNGWHCIYHTVYPFLLQYTSPMQWCKWLCKSTFFPFLLTIFSYNRLLQKCKHGKRCGAHLVNSIIPINCDRWLALCSWDGI